MPQPSTAEVEMNGARPSRLHARARATLSYCRPPAADWLPETCSLTGHPDGHPHVLDRIEKLKREIRERRTAEAELRRQKRAAEEANLKKGESLAAMSHEMRTPLHAILGYLQLLEAGGGGGLRPEQATQIDRIRKATEHLSSIVQTSLTLSALEVGKVEPNREWTDAVRIASEALELIAPAADEKELTTSLHRSEERISFWTDPPKVRQILVNLLSNGVKFTDAGQIRVTVRQANGWVLFRVSDSGTGIPAEHQERIFEPFWRSDRGQGHEATGSGLGLAVTQGLARLLGGGVRVKSAPGCGSTFSLRLPLAGPSPGNRESS